MDIPNMIDFMLLWTSGNSESEFRSVGSVPLGVPFKFFIKDADGYLRPPNHAVTHNGPLNAMTRLKEEIQISKPYSPIVSTNISSTTEQ